MVKLKKCSKHRDYKGVRRPTSGCPECVAYYEVLNPDPKLSIDLSLLEDKYQYQIKQDKKKYEELLRRYKDISVALNAVKLMRENTKAIKIPLPRGFNKHSKSVVVAALGDVHYEETVKPESVNGRNEYNLVIANKRISYYFQNLLRLIKMFQQDVIIDTVVLALLGDFISNYLHDDQRETNSLPPMVAIMEVQILLEAGIRLLLEQTDCNLKIPCVFGNHGRITEKKRSNNQSGISLEYLMYLEMARNFAGEKRVQFDIATGTHLYVPIFDRVVRFHHGDKIRYQGGIGGITIPANKAIAQWNRIIHADIDVFGHWHQMLDNGNFVINGSLIGYNAYALDIKASFEPPQQVMFLMNDKIPQRIVAPINLGPD